MPHPVETVCARPAVPTSEGRAGSILDERAGVTLAFIALQVARGYWDQTREFTEIVLPAELALIGSATAFYFATERRD